MEVVDVGDNLTQIILGVLTLLGVIVSGVFTVIATGRAGRAELNSLLNTNKLVDVEKKVDGISKERVDRETALGDAKAEVRFHEGGDIARKEGLDIAKELLNRVPIAPLPPSGPSEVVVVNPVSDPVKVEPVSDKPKPKA